MEQNIKNICKKHIWMNEKILPDITQPLINNPQLILFLYSSSKKILVYNFDSIKERDYCVNSYLNILKFINKKVKVKKYGKHLIFYKTKKINIDKFLNNSLYESELYGIPQCCSKKYLKEENLREIKKQPKSLLQATRYIQDLYKFKIGDDDFVRIEGGGVFCRYGFVPCSPKCVGAKKIKKYYENIVTGYYQKISKEVLK